MRRGGLTEPPYLSMSKKGEEKIQGQRPPSTGKKGESVLRINLRKNQGKPYTKKYGLFGRERKKKLRKEACGKKKQSQLTSFGTTGKEISTVSSRKIPSLLALGVGGRTKRTAKSIWWTVKPRNKLTLPGKKKMEGWTRSKKGVCR